MNREVFGFEKGFGRFVRAMKRRVVEEREWSVWRLILAFGEERKNDGGVFLGECGG